MKQESNFRMVQSDANKRSYVTITSGFNMP